MIFSPCMIHLLTSTCGKDRADKSGAFSPSRGFAGADIGHLQEGWGLEYAVIRAKCAFKSRVPGPGCCLARLERFYLTFISQTYILQSGSKKKSTAGACG